jgi:hypothetical protein
VTPNRDTLARTRSTLIKQAAIRFRLTYVQLGFAFEPIRENIIAGAGVTQVKTRDLMAGGYEPSEHKCLIVTDLEQSVLRTGQVSLGGLREEVIRRVDAGQIICFVSRAPRYAYAAIPGSSLLEDSAFVAIPLLSAEESERDTGPRWARSWRLPCIALDAEPDVPALLRALLQELGPGILAALDHALFEIDPKSTSGLAYLDPRELEALRCAGLIMRDEGADHWILVVSEYVRELKDALGDLMSAATGPPLELRSVAEGLWFVERALRAEVRSLAVKTWGNAWRDSVLGGLAPEVLRRAQLDSAIASTTIGQLRDPLEWLTLGELIDIAQSEKFGGLGKSPVLWRKLQEQLVPIRNRLAHVRMLKGTDEEIVATWVGAVRSWFK